MTRLQAEVEFAHETGESGLSVQFVDGIGRSPSSTSPFDPGDAGEPVFFRFGGGDLVERIESWIRSMSASATETPGRIVYPDESEVEVDGILSLTYFRAGLWRGSMAAGSDDDTGIAVTKPV